MGKRTRVRGEAPGGGGQRPGPFATSGTWRPPAVRARSGVASAPERRIVVPIGATTPSGSEPPPLPYDNPALPRIGWHRESLVSLAVVGLGYLIGLVGPSLVVSP